MANSNQGSTSPHEPMFFCTPEYTCFATSLPIFLFSVASSVSGSYFLWVFVYICRTSPNPLRLAGHLVSAFAHPAKISLIIYTLFIFPSQTSGIVCIAVPKAHQCPQRSGERSQNDASAPRRGPSGCRLPLPLGSSRQKTEKLLCLLFSLYWQKLCTTQVYRTQIKWLGIQRFKS